MNDDLTASGGLEDADPGGFEGVAIVGMSARLPGAADLETYWHNLSAGVESIRFFPDAELLAAGVEPARLRDPNYVKARGTLDDVELFDAGFFGFTPREAETMDPQHRLFLEQAWTALEHAGYDTGTYGGAIGVFAGANLTGYLIHNLAPNDELVKRVGPLQIRIRNDKDFLATLVAYKLDLRGPAVNVQTACSSSLVGVCLACQSLLSYQCDMALAGGVSVTVPNPSGYTYQEGVYAPDGHCRAFDAGARGTVLGDGVAVVVLKRLEDARADGDTIHAVIRGFATNNDGSLKLDYTAPSVDGQAEVIGMAHALGEIDAATITYVEAHGTGTPLGDPIEIAALTQAFRRGTERRGFCGIGSVKTNIGHLDAAAGTASLIKTVLALAHRELPPSLHFTAPNPQLDLAASPFYVVSERRPWAAGTGVPRRAGVSSFGVGGTNAHVVVEEAPATPAAAPSQPWQLLTLSARVPAALERAAAALADHLEARPELDLADVAFTLARGRRPFELRRALVCRDTADAVAVLRGGAPQRLATGEIRLGARRSVAFLFSGIGDHYPGMGRELYDREPVFRAALDEAAEILEPLLGLDPRAILYPHGAAAAAEVDAGTDLRRLLGRGETPADPHAERLDRTELLHPVLLMLEIALGRQWLAWGVRPEAMIGYSIGEYAAAHLAGVFTLEGVLRLVAGRARIIAGQPAGAMLAVTLPEPELAALLAEVRWHQLSLAAVNGPAFCVVSGSVAAVEELAAELARHEIVHRRLKARHPFHSRQLEAVLGEFRTLMRGLELTPPAIPFLSNVSGGWITPEEATDPGYWAEHLCRTVRFGDGVDVLLAAEDRILLEIGPGQSLTSIALQSPAAKASTVALASLPHAAETRPAQAFLLHTLGRLWTAGVVPDWQAVHGDEPRRRVPLPTYPFERQRYWVEPVARTAAPVSSLDKKPDAADWFYVPVWHQTRPQPAPAPAAGPWLVLADSARPGEALAAALGATGVDVTVATPADLETLLRTLAEHGRLPRHLVHLGNVEPAGADVLDRGFYSLLALAQAWGNVAGAARELALTVVSSGAFEVTGEEELEPEKATLAGPCRGIPQEYPGVTCRWIDLAAPRDGEVERWATQLAAEIAQPAPATVALRGRHRWVQAFEAVRLGPFDAQTNRLREGGVVVITGGLGGIGLALADFLAENRRARLVLVGRSPSTERRISARLEALERLGAEILVVRGDVTRRDDMEAVRRAALARFGAIHAVIHAAGQPPGGLIQLKDRATAAAVLAPKVTGTRIVDEVFGGLGLDVLVLCSSLTAITGALGLADHAAANAFLDAYARRSAQRGGTPVVAIGWDSWLEVGQAAAAGVADHVGAFLDRRTAAPAPAEGAPRYPALARQDDGAAGEQIFLSRLAADHWVVAEHWFQGVGLLPGTAYLDLFRRAAEPAAGTGAITLRDVVFAQPCTLAAGAERVLRVRLSAAASGWRAVVESWDDGVWQKHARARIEPGAAVGGEHELASAARYPARAADAERDREAAWVRFGPRWRAPLRELGYGEDAGWARLELPTELAGDLADFALHPALADVATGIARVLGEHAYLPLGYDTVTIRDRLPASLRCHFRKRAAADAEGTLVCDVTVADADGRSVLEVAGYTLRRLDAGTLPALPNTAGRASAGATREASLGLLPREGADTLGRLLAASFAEPHALVSVRDFAAVRTELARLTGARAAEHMKLLATTGHPIRGGARAPYEAPRSDLERRLAELYQDMLGVERVGIHDNFFDLGGNSLVATQLISRVRELFQVEIVLRALFEAPTVAQLGVVVVREQAALVDEDELQAALAELASLSPEQLRERIATAQDEPRFSDVPTRR